MQHTSLGVLWWSGGMLGLWNARQGKRSVVPAVIILLTGWAMSAHAQATFTSTKVHSAFGATLALASSARIVDITFLSPRRKAKGVSVQAFQHLSPFLLIAAGILFMAATDEELRYIDSIEMDHVTYILLIFSVAFLIYLLTNVLLHLYSTTGRNAEQSGASDSDYQPLTVYDYDAELGGLDNDHPSPTVVATADAEEFKL